MVCAGPPGRDVFVGGYPGFANPSGELQPGLLRKQPSGQCEKLIFKQRHSHTARRACSHNSPG